MTDVNVFVASGRLGKDPVLGQTQSGTYFCNGSIACKERYKDKDGNWHDATVWVSFKIWGPRAEPFAKLHKKGDYALLTGKFATDNYEKDGQRRSFSYMKVDDFTLTGGGSGGGQQQQTQQWGSQPQQPAAPAQPQQPGFPDDVPF